MADTLKSYAVKAENLAKAWSGLKLKQAMARIGGEAEKLATKAASADLGGDPKFSGWKPRLEVEIKHTGPGQIVIHPSRFSAGPWTVAEQGRLGDFQGPGINARTGRTARRKDGSLRKMRGRPSAKRWTGTTAGKSTASDAVAMFNRELPKAVEKEWGRAIGDTFGR